jgi:phosphotransferase system IIB component
MQGQLTQQPRFPLWMLSLAGLLLLFSCIGGGFLLNYVQGERASAAATEQAAQAATRQAAEAAAQAALIQQTAQAGDAATATAQAIAANDDDGDGLSNQDEAALGLDSQNPDTDGDGLSDGEEVNLHGTQPKNQDSDADGVKDGDEVAAGTFPNNSDSDNDGLLDGADPAPLATSTPTPDFQATTAAEEAAAAAEAEAEAETQAATATAQAHTAATATAQAAMTATAEAQAAAQAALEAQFESFVDTWVNVDGATRGMTRLVIERVDDNTVTFHGFGACTPNDCDWDQITVPFTPPLLEGTYDFGYKTTRIRVTVVDEDTIEAEVFDDYTDADGRTDRTTTYQLERLSVRQEALEALSGDWRNVDTGTGGMTRLVIGVVDERTISLHGFGACTPNDCDWGTTTARYKADGSTGVWTFSFKTTTITLTRDGDVLHITTLDEYNDGRADRTSHYVMRK